MDGSIRGTSRDQSPVPDRASASNQQAHAPEFSGKSGAASEPKKSLSERVRSKTESLRAYAGKEKSAEKKNNVNAFQHMGSSVKTAFQEKRMALATKLAGLDPHIGATAKEKRASVNHEPKTHWSAKKAVGTGTSGVKKTAAKVAGEGLNAVYQTAHTGKSAGLGAVALGGSGIHKTGDMASAAYSKATAKLKSGRDSIVELSKNAASGVANTVAKGVVNVETFAKHEILPGRDVKRNGETKKNPAITVGSAAKALKGSTVDRARRSVANAAHNIAHHEPSRDDGVRHGYTMKEIVGMLPGGDKVLSTASDIVHKGIEPNGRMSKAGSSLAAKANARLQKGQATSGDAPAVSPDTSGSENSNSAAPFGKFREDPMSDAKSTRPPDSFIG